MTLFETLFMMAACAVCGYFYHDITGGNQNEEL